MKIASKLFPSFADNVTPLKAGMIISNEPGFYEDNGYGIRIENLVMVKEAQTAHSFGQKKYFSFEPITYVPIQTSMIDIEGLTKVLANYFVHGILFFQSSSLKSMTLKRDVKPQEVELDVPYNKLVSFSLYIYMYAYQSREL